MGKVSDTQNMRCFLHKHGFDYDVFFSYSHGDPRGEGDAPLKDWSRQLCTALGRTLDVLTRPPAQPPRIFRDESADGADKTAHLGPELVAKVHGSALFQIVMSPHYLESPWCLRELEMFVDSLPDKERGVAGRVFIAKAMDTDDTPWPAALCDEDGHKTLGWEFHKRGAPLPDGWMKEWTRDLPNESFSANLMDLASRISAQLKKLDAELTERKRKEELVRLFEAGQIESIYLYGRCDEAAAWDAVWNEMKDLNIPIQPGEPEPLDVDEDATKRSHYCHLASLSDVMVIVGSDGAKLDFDLNVVGRVRRNLIASVHQKYLPCAVVDRSGSLSKPARVTNAKHWDIDWIDTRSCDWPNYLRTWLRGPAADKVRRRYGLEPAPS